MRDCAFCMTAEVVRLNSNRKLDDHSTEHYQSVQVYVAPMLQLFQPVWIVTYVAGMYTIR